MNNQTARLKIIQRANLYSVSAVDLAEYFIAEIDDIIPLQNGHFMEFTGKRWELRKDIATKYFSQVIESLEEIASELSQNASAHLKSRIGWFSSSRVSTILKYVRGLKSHAIIDWDDKPYVLNVGNGIVDLTDGTIIPHTKEILQERISEIEYDQNAPEPERWMRFLYEIFDGSEEIIEYVQRVVGYCLTGETHEQKMWYLIGKRGANGKSIFLDTIKSLMGDYAITADPTVFTKSNITIRNDIARLKSRRLIILPELDAEARVDELTVKRITGGDMITARFLNKETFEFKIEGKVIVASNYYFKSNGSPALERRIRSIPFDVSFRGREDMNLRDDLYAERKSIFKWAVDGAVKYYQTGLGKEPPEVKVSTKEMQLEANPTRKFAQERLDCRALHGAWMTISDAYDLYLSWCSDNGHTPENKIMFSKRMREALPHIKNDIMTISGKTTRIWRLVGPKLKEERRGTNLHPDHYSVLTEEEQASYL